MTRGKARNFTARPALPNDVEHMISIQHAAVEKAWRPVLKDKFDPFFRERFDTQTQIKKYLERLQDPARIFIVVEEDGHGLAGFAGAYPNPLAASSSDQEYQGSAFYLHPSYEGSGASHVLAMALSAELKKRGVQKVVGWCLAGNRLARNFYERRGATLVQDAEMPEEYNIAPHVAYEFKIIS